jgi:processive 1,2-diacylglycerol beta-glucosyltransferase
MYQTIGSHEVRMPRVLLLHASVGTGHKRAAEALRTAFEVRQPGQVRVEDVLDHTSKFFRLAYSGSYLELTDHAPLVWGYFYTQADVGDELSELTNNIRRMVESIGTTDLKELLKKFKPEIIVCTHFLPMELLVTLKRNARLLQPVYCVITDHAAHTFWTYTDIDGYFVGSEMVREQMIERGVPAAHVHVTGIPIDPVISEPKDCYTERQRLGLSTDERVVTLFGGGVSTDNVRKVCEDLLKMDIRGTLVVVAGRNETLKQGIADLQCGPTLNLRVLGYIDYVDSLVAASDLVITKAGGLIISEVLARGVPIIVIDPILGHEEWNADFVVNSGAGVQLRMIRSVPRMVQRLLQSPHLLAEMRENAAAAGCPRAAQRIAERVIADYMKSDVSRSVRF